MKKLLFFIIFVVLTFLILNNYSETTYKYQCIGLLKSSITKKEDIRLFIKYDAYRPWVKLWNSSDGGLRIEIPKYWTQYYSYVLDTGDKDDHLHFHTKKSDEMGGYFSRLSKSIWVKIDLNNEIYEGECKEIK